MTDQPAAAGVPAKAILDAAKAIENAIGYWDGWVDAAGLAREAVRAAAPHITAAATTAERDRIIALIEAEERELRAGAEDACAQVLSEVADLIAGSAP